MGDRYRKLCFSCCLLLLAGCTDGIVNFFAFYPMRFNADDYSLSDTSVQELEVVTEDQVRLHAFYLPVPSSSKLVIFLHGNAGHNLHRLSQAQRLARSGVNVLLLSYRGYGRSEGSPSEYGVYRDGRAALQHAVDHLGFAPENIFLLGRSLGSAVAIDMAQHQSLGGLILISAFISAHDLMQTAGLGWLGWLVDRRPFDQLSKLPHISTPALFIHGTQDRQVPYRLGEALYAQYPSEYKQMLSVQKAGHNDLFLRDGEIIWQRIAAFIDNPVCVGCR